LNSSFFLSCFIFPVVDSLTTTSFENESNHTHPDVFLPSDATATAYALLNEALDITSTITESTTVKKEAPSSTTTTITNPTDHARTPLSNISLNSTLSPIQSVDAGSHLIDSQKNELKIFHALISF